MEIEATEIVTRFGPALVRIAASYERNPALRDELAQDVLLAVVTSLPRLAQSEKLKPFVFRIAHNRCLTHAMRRMRERDAEQQLEELAADPGHEQALMERERGARLMDAVRLLKLPYRQVITLLLEDLTYEEIAESLGISAVNVGVRVNRAKQQLKAMLANE